MELSIDCKMEWNNSKNQKCRFFFNTKTNHYVLSVNGMYYEHSRLHNNNLITDEELSTFDSLDVHNMRDNIDFLKRLSDEINPFRNVNIKSIQKNNHEIIQNKSCKTTKINNCIVYF